jgi:hypothetical protein
MPKPQRLMRRLAQIALALVLLAPVVAGTHVHGFGTEASPACGVCTVAKHAPGVVGESISVATSVLSTQRIVPTPADPVVSGQCWRPGGRAPPASSSGYHT